MNNKRIVLLKTLLLSTDRLNKAKYSSDKKAKSKAIGTIIGISLLYLMIMFYSIMICVGYGVLGIANDIPVICAATISFMALIFTFFKTNGYLFNFKEYDMLMALPFEPKTIASNKFLYMYIKTLPWYLSISISMMIGYGIYEKPGILAYIIWIWLTFILPIIPMLVASFLGFLIAKFSSGFKKKNIVQTILTFVFVIFCFSLQYIIEAIFKSDNQKVVLEGISGSIEEIGDFYYPIIWFATAVKDNNVISLVILTLLSVILFEIVFWIVGKNYRQINSALKSHACSKAYEMTSQRRKSVVNTIAFKEYKRLTGSTTYLVNCFMGEVLASLLGIAVLIFGFDKIVTIITKGAPIDCTILFPAIPLFIYFFIGMLASTACSPSLEGKNYWIMQSLPIEMKTIYKGKMLFNMYLTVPFAIFSTLCFCISGKVNILETLFYLVEIIALCAFSTTWGCVCGIKHMKLDWENEIEVVKQGTAVVIYLLPNMFVTMGLVVLVVFLGLHISSTIISFAIIFIVLILAFICYMQVLKLAKKKSYVRC